mgnify:FL=1
MLSEKSLFNFDALNYFLHRPEDWLLCYCFYMSTYWLMIGQDFALSAKNHESALSLLLLSSHGCWKQSQLCQVFNLAWVNAKLISHEEEFEISLLCSKKKHQDRWDLKGCCCGREVFSPIICSLAKIEHKASYTVHYTVANISSGTFF